MSNLFTLICYVIVTVYWSVSSFGNKETVYQQPALIRWLTRLAPSAGYVLVFTPLLDVRWFGQRFIPDSFPIRLVGVFGCVAGLAFATWARRTIGKNWSGNVTLKKDHELVRTGPYALVRHPIYTGLLLAIAGTAVVLGEWRGIVAVMVTALGFANKIRAEEGIMMRQFPGEYPEYRMRVKRIIPFLY
ncbi:MAG: isoprenylcysteine carboxylmethyltransferase family protein [Candidatus Hydrogenedentes bacterium]|nr:isoprenylcysteine carboxylmethyltransferase family protein [Candidatus Hydrogenedentota bacterium]